MFWFNEIQVYFSRRVAVFLSCSFKLSTLCLPPRARLFKTRFVTYAGVDFNLGVNSNGTDSRRDKSKLTAT